MNQLIGLLLVVTGIALARWSPHLLRAQTVTARQDEPANPNASEPWMFAASLGLVAIGLAALTVEPVGVLLALLLPGVLLCTGLAANALALDRAGRRHGPLRTSSAARFRRRGSPGSIGSRAFLAAPAECRSGHRAGGRRLDGVQ
jgi:hypothetical protein